MKPEPRIAGARRCDTAIRPVPRLYYMPRTRSSRVLWLLAELDAPCELVKLAPEQRTSAEHRARHPLGRVPALELDDGTVMFESAAICLQLADLHPEASLIAPVGSPERALVYQWVLFAMTELEAPLFRWIRETAEDSADPSSRERFAQAAAALQTALDGRDWLLGDRFTVADVMCASVLGGAHSRGLLTEWPGLQAYVERGESRPAFRGRNDHRTSTLAPHISTCKPSTGGSVVRRDFLHRRVLTVTGTVAATPGFGRISIVRCGTARTRSGRFLCRQSDRELTEVGLSRAVVRGRAHGLLLLSGKSSAITTARWLLGDRRSGP
jgi:glutathione S-transferase